jgi:CO/xanthine dehydrogenase Mo-binding subunit
LNGSVGHLSVGDGKGSSAARNSSVGECAQGPTAAAVANAVYDALDIRVRLLPLTVEQLIAAIPD